MTTTVAGLTNTRLRLKGAAAAIIITRPARGYPYEVVSGSWSRENFDIVKPDRHGPRCRRIMDYDGPGERVVHGFRSGFRRLKKAAVSKDFKPVELKAKANITVQTRCARFSHTVSARSKAQRRRRVRGLSAHWDHLGLDPKLQGDQIFNGALDNASGIAAMLEIAEGFTKLGTPPKRSILFLAVTAEEKGLLGAKYYGENPLYPLNKTLANINMDGVNQWGHKDIRWWGRNSR